MEKQLEITSFYIHVKNKEKFIHGLSELCKNHSTDKGYTLLYKEI